MKNVNNDRGHRVLMVLIIYECCLIKNIRPAGCVTLLLSPLFVDGPCFSSVRLYRYEEYPEDQVPEVDDMPVGTFADKVIPTSKQRAN